MSLNGLNSASVRFTKENPSDSRMKKNYNFFDEEDDEFESFADDKDFIRMTSKVVDNDEDEKELGNAWGGSEYSFHKESNSSDVSESKIKTTIAPSEPAVFSPFYMRDNIKTNSKYVNHEETTIYREENSMNKTSTTRTHEAIETKSIEHVIQATNSEMADVERNKLKMQIKELQQTSLHQQNKKTPEPEETVRKIMMNQPCILEVYKSLKDKVSLLDAAIKLGDGDALTTVLLFFKKSVKFGIFLNEIKDRPVAITHLTAFLKAHYEIDELIKILKLLNRDEEALMLEYKKALSSSNVDLQIQGINSCQRIYERTPQLSDMVAVLNEHQNLLKRQVNIEIKDKRTKDEGKDQMLRPHPRQSVTSTPLIATLRYCCLYHFGKDDDVLGPVSFQKQFKLTDKQLEWTMIGARSELKKWNDLETLFTSKSWYGSNKLKSSLGFDKVVGILVKYNAPSDILSKYLLLVEDIESRLLLATKLQCHKVAVETIVNMKDKQRLEEYRKNIQRVHPIQALISQYLTNLQIKWK